jgi:hypothetical protein
MTKLSLVDEITEFDDGHQAILWKPGMVKPGRGSLKGLVSALASPFVSQAAISAALATASAEAAAYNRKVYATTVAGLADTTPGEYFFMPSTADDEFLIQWKHEADGSATEIARSPSIGILSTLVDVRDGAIEAASNADAKAALAETATANADAKAALAETAAADAYAAREAALDAIGTLLQEPIYFAAEPGQTTFELEVAPIAGVEVWKNGFRLPPSAYMLVGRFVSLSEPCDTDPANPDDIIIDVKFSRAIPIVAAQNVIGLAALLARKADANSVLCLTDSAFGAKGDGDTDDSAAIQAALDVLTLRGGGSLFLPIGRFRVADTGTALTGASNIAIIGAGPGSEIFFDDRPTNPRKDMFRASNASNIEFRNFTITGTLDLYPVETNQSQCLTGENVRDVRLIDMTFRKLRYMATAFNIVENAVVEGCTFSDIFRDGARFTQAYNVRVVGNHFRRVADDAVAIHSRDDYGGVLAHGHVVDSNTFDMCQGIKVLGAKALSISDNVMIHMLRTPVEIMSEYDAFPEGNAAMFAIRVSGNIILDTLGDRYPTQTGVIRVQVRNRSKGTLEKQPGATAPIFEHAWDNNTDAAGGINIGGFGIDVTENIIGWTRKRDVKFSSYGKGLILDRVTTGMPLGYSDPLITDASYCVTGILFDGPSRGTRISRNTLFGGSLNGTAPIPAIHATADGSSANTIVVDGWAIDENTIFDWIGETAILLDHATTNGARSVSLRNNQFDLDPFFRHPSHNADGTWASASALTGIDTKGRLYNGVVDGNHFKNLSRPTPSGEQFLFGRNFVHFQPATGFALGDGPANKGVRYVPAVPKYDCIIIDGDPASATFGATITIPVRHAMAQPSTGTFVHGHFVQAAAPILRTIGSVNYLVDGWSRNGTGAAHVGGTDWFEKLSMIGG